MIGHGFRGMLSGFGAINATSVTTTGDVTAGDDLIAADDVSGATVTAPIFGTTTAVDPVFRRNSAELLRLTSDGPEIRGAAPLLGFNETDAGAQNKIWWAFASGGDWRLDAISDDASTAARALTIERTAVAIDLVRVGVSSSPVRLDVTGGLAAATPPATKTTTPYTMVAATDYAVTFDPTAASQTVNLPAAAGVRGTVFIIRKGVASANTVTIDPSGAETIEGAATLVVASNTAAMIQSDGTNWRLLGVLA